MIKIVAVVASVIAAYQTYKMQEMKRAMREVVDAALRVAKGNHSVHIVELIDKRDVN